MVGAGLGGEQLPAAVQAGKSVLEDCLEEPLLRTEVVPDS